MMNKMIKESVATLFWLCN